MAAAAGSVGATDYTTPPLVGTAGAPGLIPVGGQGACASCVDEPPPSDPSADEDKDGFTPAQGDCDDRAALVNPGAYDVANDGVDDDCQGGDATSDSCDDDLALDAEDPLQAARAIELCQQTTEASPRWGVLSGRWTSPNGRGNPGDARMHGLVPGFGPAFVPRAGQRMLAISSGVARAPGQAGYTPNCSDSFPNRRGNSGFPTGFDGSSSSCDDFQSTSVEDAVALELRVRVPTNASAIGFDSAFFTDEYPAFICSPFNDFFQVIVQPPPANGRADGDVVFDLDGNPVSVNNSLLRVCEPGRNGGKDFACPLGFDPLIGTGFEHCEGSLLEPTGVDWFPGIDDGKRDKYGASTGWLNTEFAAKPGEIVTLRFTIWDSGDSALDSTAIIDHVRFRLRSAPPPPEKPMTTPITPD